MKIFLKSAIFIGIFQLLFLSPAIGQAGCDSCTSVFRIVVDLSNSADSTWDTTGIVRQNQCCGAIAPQQCMKIILKLHPDVNMIAFDCEGGAAPGTTNFKVYVNCVETGTIRDTICSPNTDSICLVYCKPGANPNDFSITVSSEVEASPDIIVSDGCIDTIWVTGLNPATVSWNSVYPGAYGSYNNFLSCDTMCDTAIVTPSVPYPPYVDYEVKGNMAGKCSSIAFKDTVRVHFVSEKMINIIPDDPYICFGGTTATLTADTNGAGGAPPYHFLWNTGDTTQSITVNDTGYYWVRLKDATDCPPVYDTVYVRNQTVPITVNAGSDTILCAHNPIIQLNGSVTIATGGVWSTNGAGPGIFNDDSLLNAIYYATNDLLALDSTILLCLTSTGNHGCPAVSDTLQIQILPSVTLSAGPDQFVCGNTPFIVLNGSYSNTTGITWRSTGTGTFQPDSTSATCFYYPSAADTATGSVLLIIKNIDGCEILNDTMVLSFLPAPQVNAGPDQTICSNEAVVLNGQVWGATSTGNWTSPTGGLFLPNSATLGAIYYPTTADTANGSVVLTLTSTNNGSCLPSSDQLTVYINPAPVLTISSPDSICTGLNFSATATVVNGIGTGSWSGGLGGTFIPSNAAATITYNPSAADYAAGSVTLTYSGNGLLSCNPAVQSITVVFLPIPIVDAGPDDTVLCSNIGIINLTGSVSGGTTTGIWTTSGTGIFGNANNLITTYTPSDEDTAAGAVILTLTSTSGCTDISDQMLITF